MHTPGMKIKHLVIGLGLGGGITVIAFLAWIWRYTYQRSQKFGSKVVGKPLQGVMIAFKYLQIQLLSYILLRP
jgi:hypothetical protein